VKSRFGARSLLAGVFLAFAAADGGATSIAKARQEILKQTMPYLNIPYLWGGQHPSTGLDCSGFVQLVYHQAGFSLPRASLAQFSATRPLKPKEVLPGDLVFFAMSHPGTDRIDHVGIYLGKGLFIAASTTSGIHVEQISKRYYVQRLVAVRRYRGF
jgi:cell wall-associated NlpC family hydrolase